ncbi:MAG TPA: hypothetical protein VNJ04_05425 [Gemmatimonadaceae bacterium]|nr:hypothetical protein [Gemmatimonadaceae bacterium]
MRPRGVATDGRPAGLSASTIAVFLLGWASAPIAPVGEPGRWQLALLSTDEQRALWLEHRDWLREEATRRGLHRPWAEGAYGRGPTRPRDDAA